MLGSHMAHMDPGIEVVPTNTHCFGCFLTIQLDVIQLTF